MFKLANCAKVIPLWTVFFFSSYTYIARLSGSSIKTLHLQGRNSWWCHCVFWHRAQSLTVSIKRSIRRCRCRTQVLGGYFCMYRNWWWHVLQVNSKTPSWSRGRQKTLAQHGVICSKRAKNSFLTPKGDRIILWINHLWWAVSGHMACVVALKSPLFYSLWHLQDRSVAFCLVIASTEHWVL